MLNMVYIYIYHIYVFVVNVSLSIVSPTLNKQIKC